MNALFVLYIALSVFGVGVSVMDLFGFLADRDSGSGNSDDAGGHDGGGHDGAAEITDGSDAPDAGDADSAGDDGDNYQHDSDTSHDSHAVLDRSPRDAGRIVGKAISLLRLSVWAAFGAGPTGLFALLTGASPLGSLLWSGAGAIVVTAISRVARFIARRELDSTLREEEFLMDRAVISVPVEPGKMGKALLRRYERDVEVYVRASRPDLALPKGTPVILADLDSGIYIVELEKEERDA